VAINLYLLGLIGLAVGLPQLSPVMALWGSLPLGLPATWAAARWVRSLIREAEGRKEQG
jgi:membrane protein implicated in regulation of membrane protease activity